MGQLFLYFIQSIILLILTPLFMGLIKKVKAFIRGYNGVPIFQMYYDIIKLFKKGRVISRYSSFVTKIGPTLSIAAAITAAFIIPVFYTGKDNYVGNMFIIIFLLAIVKFTNTLFGLDCASTFGGMGSSRELFISMLAEPVMFVIIAFLYFETYQFNIFGIAYINSNTSRYSVAHIIAGIAFFVLILAENARMPVDNPETHLELTMIHEAMILDISGSDLALVELSSSIKLMIFLTIFINSFIPYGIATSLNFILVIKGIIFYFGKLIICCIVISLIETVSAKFRLFRIPEVLAAAFSISIVALAINYFI